MSDFAPLFADKREYTIWEGGAVTWTMIEEIYVERRSHHKTLTSCYFHIIILATDWLLARENGIRPPVEARDLSILHSIQT
jgi:hypothetical protein